MTRVLDRSEPPDTVAGQPMAAKTEGGDVGRPASLPAVPPDRHAHAKKLLWVTWEDHRRSRSLARVLDAELREFADTLGRARLVRYVLNIHATVSALRRRAPEVVICQLPSFVLAVLMILLRPMFGYRLGFDAHNSGLGIEAGWFVPLHWLAGWVQRRADFMIVHNDPVEAFVKGRGGKLIVLPDPLPTITPRAPLDLPRPFNLLFVCRFKPDEPYLEVLKAARLIDPEIGIYVTGNPRGKVNPKGWPDNVVFCGWVSWEYYDQLLYSVNGVIDLSTRERCLVCGAYEAVAAGKPMILSRTQTLMNYFHRGAVFTDNSASCSPHSISRAILEVRAREAELKADVAILKEELTRDWNARLQRLLALL